MDSEISPQGYRSPLFLSQRTERQKAEERERGETLSQLPLLKQVIGRLDKRISATDSIKQALIVANKYGIDREQALIVLDLVRQQLEVERSFIQVRVDKASK